MFLTNKNYDKKVAWPYTECDSAQSCFDNDIKSTLLMAICPAETCEGCVSRLTYHSCYLELDYIFFPSCGLNEFQRALREELYSICERLSAHNDGALLCWMNGKLGGVLMSLRAQPLENIKCRGYCWTTWKRNRSEAWLQISFIKKRRGSVIFALWTRRRILSPHHLQLYDKRSPSPPHPAAHTAICAFTLLHYGPQSL